MGFRWSRPRNFISNPLSHELLWFLAGDTNIKYLKDNGVSIWDEWADENGDLGPVYGSQWRRWPSGTDMGPIDQITDLVEVIKKTPDSRRLIVSAWNPAEVPDMALPPCHTLWQVRIAGGQAAFAALPALCGYVPWCAIQHRLLRSFAAYVGACDGA